MYIYDFYNFDYDDTTTVKLMHDKKFSKDEFESMVKKCIKEVSLKLKKNILRIEQIEVNDHYVSNENYDQLLNLSSECQINVNVFYKLEKEYGFRKLEPLYTFTFNDGYFGIKPIPVNGVK